MSLQVFSFGGGVQSTAALVLAARGELDGITTFLFSNVGDDSENPATLRYVREVAMPYAVAHGLRIIELHKTRKDGSRETLYEYSTRPGSQIIIPVRLGGSGMPANRSCTKTFKIATTAKWLREHGARKTRPAEMSLGISIDEFQRMRNASGYGYITLRYPLIERRLSRRDCQNLITEAGLPTPPKSSCWFCPFARMSRWRQLRDEAPELFEQAVQMEQTLQQKARRYKDTVWLTAAQKPLDLAVGSASQMSLFADDEETFSCGPFVCAVDDGLGGAA